MQISAYSQRIPGVTAYTPVYQLGVDQTPMLSGLGVAATDNAGTVTSVLDKAKQIVSDNPLPALLLIGFLLLRR
jgi:hypothetical protein